jgi:hypothetical protein
VGEAIQAGRPRLPRGREQNQHAIAQAFYGVTQPSTEGEFTIVPQNPKTTNSIGAQPRR